MAALQPGGDAGGAQFRVVFGIGGEAREHGRVGTGGENRPDVRGRLRRLKLRRALEISPGGRVEVDREAEPAEAREAFGELVDGIDTWHWNESAERTFDEVVTGPHSDAAIMLRAMRSALGENDMMAYLATMAVRLIELHGVLKPTASLHLHCDAVASHYLKILFDSIFGLTNCLSEIIWRRSPSHNKLSKQYGPIHDTILFFAKSEEAIFHPGQTPYTRSYIESEFRSPMKLKSSAIGLRNRLDFWRRFYS
jgi:hypothetical protein